MQDFDGSELTAVEARLAVVVNAIVARHREAGDVLTWRLLHQIEDEAFERITEARELKPMYIRMMRSSGFMDYPRTDEPVDFGDSNALPAAFFLIQNAFKRVDA